MLIDSNLLFTGIDGQAITASAASTYELDTGEADANLGRGTPLIARFVVVASFVTLTSLTISIQDSAAGSSYADIVVSRALLLAELVAGFQWDIAIPRHHHRFLQAYFTVGGSNPGSDSTIVGWLDIAG
jgi:hypothetical protein